MKPTAWKVFAPALLTLALAIPASGDAAGYWQFRELNGYKADATDLGSTYTFRVSNNEFMIDAALEHRWSASDVKTMACIFTWQFAQDLDRLVPGESLSVQVSLANTGNDTYPVAYLFIGQAHLEAGKMGWHPIPFLEVPVPAVGKTVTGTGQVVIPSYDDWGEKELAIRAQVGVGRSADMERVYEWVEGDDASAGAQPPVQASTLSIVKESPAGDTIVLDQPASFRATLSPAPANSVRYRWQPHPEAEFLPYESPDESTIARFDRPGPVRVWANALAAESTIAESNSLELTIVAPTLTLTAVAPAAVGQTGSASVRVAPEVRGGKIGFRWSLSENARLVSEAEDSRSVVFTALDSEPIRIEAEAFVPFYGDDLGRTTATVKVADSKVPTNARMSYTHPSGDYRLQLPAGWQVRENAENGKYDALSGGDRPNIFSRRKVIVAGADAATKLEAIALDQTRKLADSGYYLPALGQLPAICIHQYLAEHDSMVWYLWFAHGESHYGIMISAYPGTGRHEQLPADILRILNSIEFLD